MFNNYDSNDYDSFVSLAEQKANRLIAQKKQTQLFGYSVPKTCDSVKKNKAYYCNNNRRVDFEEVK